MPSTMEKLIKLASNMASTTMRTIGTRRVEDLLIIPPYARIYAHNNFSILLYNIKGTKSILKTIFDISKSAVSFTIHSDR